MEITRKIIKLPIGSIGMLVKDFGKSRTTVNNALRGITHSELAKNIRQRAKEMLLEEAADIDEKQNN